MKTQDNILKIEPEAIKPGLHVRVNWEQPRGGENFYPGVVIRKLRKNWLVKVNRALPYDYDNDNQNVSVPYEAMTINTGFTKEGRPLMDNKEDKQYLFSKEHADYMQSFLVVPENKTIKHKEIPY